MKRTQWRVSRRPKSERQDRTGRGERAKSPSELREAVIAATERYGKDGHGEGGLVGFFEEIARSDPGSLLRLVTPYIAKAKGEAPKEIRTTADFIEELNRRGIAPPNLRRPQQGCR